jgi:hypothetical protein
VDAQAQGAAQGLLSMSTVAHRPLVRKPTLGLQEPVTITSVSSHVQQPAFGKEADEAALAQHKPTNDPQDASIGEAQTKAMNPAAADGQTKAMNPAAADGHVTDADGNQNGNVQVQASAGRTNTNGKQPLQALTKLRELTKGEQAKTPKCEPCMFNFYSDSKCTEDSAAGQMSGTVEKKDVNREIKSVRFSKKGCTLWLYSEALPQGRVWISPKDSVCLERLVDKENRQIGKVLMARSTDDTCQP